MSQQRVTGFSSVLDFYAPRSLLACIGFYAFHVVVAGIVLSAIGVALGQMTGLVDAHAITTAGDMHQQFAVGIQEGKKVAAKFVPALSFIYCTAVFMTIVAQRTMWKNPWYVGALLITVVLSLGGTIFGLFPAAVTLGIDPKNPSDRSS
jgi:hypothetical protein